MAQNYFIGRDQAWLEQKLREIQDVLVSGQRFTRVESAGNVGMKEEVRSAESVYWDIRWALYLLDPEDWPYEAQANRTKAVIYNSGS